MKEEKKENRNYFFLTGQLASGMLDAMEIGDNFRLVDKISIEELNNVPIDGFDVCIANKALWGTLKEDYGIKSKTQCFKFKMSKGDTLYMIQPNKSIYLYNDLDKLPEDIELICVKVFKMTN